MMTVHASKGLQFKAVFVPALGTGSSPLPLDSMSFVPQATRTFDTLFLLTGEEWPVDSKPEQVSKGVQKYQDAVDGILAGEFRPKLNERTCPKCPHYFICPGKGED
jgi:hypothetical protein